MAAVNQSDWGLCWASVALAMTQECGLMQVELLLKITHTHIGYSPTSFLPLSPSQKEIMICATSDPQVISDSLERMMLPKES